LVPVLLLPLPLLPRCPPRDMPVELRFVAVEDLGAMVDDVEDVKRGIVPCCGVSSSSVLAKH